MSYMCDGEGVLGRAYPRLRGQGQTPWEVTHELDVGSLGLRGLDQREGSTVSGGDRFTHKGPMMRNPGLATLPQGLEPPGHLHVGL